jgi:hypothetical protein
MIKLSRITAHTNATISVCSNLTELGKFITENDWSPMLFKNSYRINENFQSTAILALDIDKDCTLEQGLELFKDYKHVIGTTRNHQKIKNPGTKSEKPACDRFRVLLFPESEINNSAEYTNTIEKLHSDFKFVDDSCKDLSRQFFRCTAIVSINEDGKLVKNIIENTSVKTYVRKKDENGKAKLANSTLEFLLNGAGSGSWNSSLYKAARDMNASGYSYEDALDKFQNMNNSHFSGALDKSDMKAIKSGFTGESKIKKGIVKDKQTVLSEYLTLLNDYFKDNILVYCPNGIDVLFEVDSDNIVKGINFNILLKKASNCLEQHDITVTHKFLSELVRTWLVRHKYSIDKMPSSFSMTKGELTFNYIDLNLEDGPTPVWDDFISRCGANGRALMAYTWSLFEKDKPTHQYLFLRGPGGDGKSSYTEWIQQIVGENAYCALDPNDVHWAAQCVGKRVGFWPEVNKTAFVMTSNFKQITGGEFTTITQKYDKAYTAMLDTKFILVTNQSIDISGDKSQKRRIILVDLTENKNYIPYYKAKIKEETNAFLFKCKQAFDELYDSATQTIECNYEDYSKHVVSFEDEFEHLFEKTFEYKLGSKVRSSEFIEALKINDGLRDKNFKTNFKNWLYREKNIRTVKTDGGYWFYMNVKLKNNNLLTIVKNEGDAV